MVGDGILQHNVEGEGSLTTGGGCGNDHHLSVGDTTTAKFLIYLCYARGHGRDLIGSTHHGLVVLSEGFCGTSDTPVPLAVINVL